jgi:hypothetical protein
VNEDQSLWKTTDVKDEEFCFPKVEEGKSLGGKDWGEWGTRASGRPQMWRMRSSGSSRLKNVRAEGGRTEMNEDQSLWKTTYVKDEEFWFLKVEEGKSWGGGRNWGEWRSEPLEDHICEGWGVLVPQGGRR